VKICIIESPFKGRTPAHELMHKRYLNLCIRDSVLRGESPYASHRMLTDALDDADPTERELGIQAGFEMREALLLTRVNGSVHVITAVYEDFGLSGGMHRGIAAALAAGCPVERRRLWNPGALPQWAEVEP
jgi:hypothetical protein